MLNDFLSPFALSVRRKTNVSKGTGNLKLFLLNFVRLIHKFILSVRTFRYIFTSYSLRKNTQGERTQTYQKSGSGILCVFMTIGGLLIVMSLAVRYATYGIDIAHQRAVQEQRYFALKGLLNYGVMLAEKQATSDVTMDIGTWLTHYTGKITITNVQDIVTVQASLYLNSNEFIVAQQQFKREQI
jgi:hypothetical protein